jgi:phosphocarrier protein HPr
MNEFTVKIKNPEGLHARPAGVLAKEAARFQANVQIEFNGKIKNAKSIMGIMGLGIAGHQDVKFMIDGPDAEQAAARIAYLVEHEFKIEN